jgi:hypothetical protein
MFPKSSIPFAPVSGFVAFDGGGAMPPAITYPSAKNPRIVVVPETAPEPVVAPEPMVPPAAVDVVAPMRETASWQPTRGVWARRVEGTVIVAMCLYFVFGLVKGLHLL